MGIVSVSTEQGRDLWRDRAAGSAKPSTEEPTAVQRGRDLFKGRRGRQAQS